MGIDKMKDGRLRNRFTINRKRETVYGWTTAEVKEKEFQRRKDIENGLYSNNKNITLDGYFPEWLTERKKRVKPTTVYNYETTYTAHISPALGKKKVQKIEKREIKAFLNEKARAGVSEKTINRILLILKMILQGAIGDEIISANPAGGIRRIKEHQPPASETIHKALTLEEQHLFMEELKCEYYYDFIALMLCTGMRAGEVSALTWRNVDQINKVIHVRATATRNKDGTITTGTPKSKAGEREIPITETAMKILCTVQEKNIIINGNALAMNNLVFFNESGGMVSGQSVNNAIARTIKRLQAKGYKIDNRTSHCMRDTFATRFIEQGGKPQTLKAILGHT